MRRFYIKATGSVCYDGLGITFPQKEEIDFETMLSELRCPAIRWENQFGWSNQPAVLTFLATGKEARELNLALPIGLIVVGHWGKQEK